MAPLCKGEHSDARAACDVPSLLSAQLTEGLRITFFLLLFHNPSGLASLAHLPLHRGGYKDRIFTTKGCRT